MSGQRRDEWIVVTEDAKTLPVIEILTGRGFITGKSGSGKSVLEGTAVYTENGRKPIEEVERGEKVLSLNQHDCQQEFREVLATISHESDELLRITLEDGTELVGTKDHSFLTIENDQIVPIRGDEVTEGTWFPLAGTLPAVERIDQIDLSEYVDDRSEIADARFLDLNFEIGRVIGVSLATNFPEDAALEYATLDEGLTTDLADSGFDRSASGPFGEFMATGFGRSASSRRLPDWVFDTPSAFKRGLISGYLDADGRIDTGAHVESESADLLRGLKELLRHFGVSSNFHAGMERGRHRLEIDGRCYDRLEAILEMRLDEKRTQLREPRTKQGGPSRADWPGRGSVSNPRAGDDAAGNGRQTAAAQQSLTSSQKTSPFAKSDVEWRRVVDIEELPEKRTVYDLDVRLNDNFIADGVFVHNSNTGGVIAEELLSNGYNLLIVDTEGEHFTLKEHFELLHVGGDEFADVEVGPSHAKKIAKVAIEQNVPVILDVSGYYDAADAEELIKAVLEHIYRLEKNARKPFLIMVEEMQEYLPQQGGGTELAALLERIAKRGRKRGLGICGMSQRPSSVDKDFITQCDWMVWHRLTWETDVQVVRNILGADRAADVQDFEPGQGILMTDWDDTIETVRFKRKRTQDAGATPGLESYERPDLKTVGSSLIREIKGEGAAELQDFEDEDPFGTGGSPEPELELEPTEEASESETEPSESADEPDPSIEAERRKNEMLAAEVHELRSILEGVEGRNSAPTVEPPRKERRAPPPRPPRPPQRPPHRDGVSGNVVEFGHMLVYLLRSLHYRLRLIYYNQRHL